LLCGCASQTVQQKGIAGSKHPLAVMKPANVLDTLHFDTLMPYGRTRGTHSPCPEKTGGKVSRLSTQVTLVRETAVLILIGLYWRRLALLCGSCYAADPVLFRYVQCHVFIYACDRCVHLLQCCSLQQNGPKDCPGIVESTPTALLRMARVICTTAWQGLAGNVCQTGLCTSI
jgi:hypothetical protein